MIQASHTFRLLNLISNHDAKYDKLFSFNDDSQRVHLHHTNDSFRDNVLVTQFLPPQRKPK